MIALDLEELRADLRATAFLVSTGLAAYLYTHILLFGQHTLYEPNKAIAAVELVFAVYGTVEAALYFKTQARKHANT